ncbi:MAG: phosphotransferase [Planctomycetota bacterium]
MVDRERFGHQELAEVLSHYDIGLIRGAKEFTRGSRKAPKLILDTPTGRYLLKRRAHGKNDPFKVAFAHALMGHLRAHRFPVPPLIGTCDDQNSMLQLGGQVYEVFEFIEAERYDGSLEQTMEAGRMLATYHEAVQDFKTEWTPPAGSYHDAPNVRAGLNAIPTVTASHDSVYGHEEELLALTQHLHEEYDAAAARLKQGGLRDWPLTIIHGDWHPGNLLFRHGQIRAVLDFDAARHQPRVIDVAYGMLQFSMLRDVTTPEQWPAYFDEARMRRFHMGYTTAGELPGEWREALPDLMSEALIAEAALPIAVTGSFGRLPGYGVLQMIARKVQWLHDNERRIRKWLRE